MTVNFVIIPISYLTLPKNINIIYFNKVYFVGIIFILITGYNTTVFCILSTYFLQNVYNWHKYFPWLQNDLYVHMFHLI